MIQYFFRVSLCCLFVFLVQCATSSENKDGGDTLSADAGNTKQDQAQDDNQDSDQPTNNTKKDFCLKEKNNGCLNSTDCGDDTLPASNCSGCKHFYHQACMAETCQTYYEKGDTSQLIVSVMLDTRADSIRTKSKTLLLHVIAPQSNNGTEIECEDLFDGDLLNSECITIIDSRKASTVNSDANRLATRQLKITKDQKLIYFAEAKTEIDGTGERVGKGCIKMSINETPFGDIGFSMVEEKLE